MKLFFTILVALSLVCSTSATWQEYIDERLIDKGQIKKAAIVSIDGSIMGISPNFRITSQEIKEIIQRYKSPNDAFSKGVTVEQIKYIAIKADNRSIYAKKGAEGVVCAKTGQVIIIGTYDASMQPGNAALTVEKLADYLLDNGY